MACSACTCILSCVDILEMLNLMDVKSGPVRKTQNIVDANLSGFTVLCGFRFVYFYMPWVQRSCILCWVGTHCSIKYRIQKELQVSLEWPLPQATGNGRQSPEHGLEEDQVLTVVLVASSLGHHRQ